MLAAIIFKEDTSRVYSADVLDPNLMSNARENRVRELDALTQPTHYFWRLKAKHTRGLFLWLLWYRRFVNLKRFPMAGLVYTEGYSN